MTQSTEADDTVKNVAERLQFFFSDANLRQDAFLRGVLLDKDSQYPNKCTLDTLLRFNTIKQYTQDPDVVLKAAKTIDAFNFSEDDKAIGRVDPFTEDKMNGHLPLSLIVDNLPTNDGRYTTSVSEVKQLFENYGKVAIVKLLFKGSKKKRKSGLKQPTGMAVVEFESKEGIDAAVEELTANDESKTPKESLKLGDNTLEILKLEGNESKLENDSKDKDTADDDEQPEEFSIDWKPGCVISIKGVADDCDREAIIEAVSKVLGINADKFKEQHIYIDFSRGCKDGAIRFNEPSDKIKELAEKLANGEVEIKGEKVSSAAILEGEEEKKYWANFIEFKNKHFRLRFEERKRKRRRKH